MHSIPTVRCHTPVLGLRTHGPQVRHPAGLPNAGYEHWCQVPGEEQIQLGEGQGMGDDEWQTLQGTTVLQHLFRVWTAKLTYHTSSYYNRIKLDLDLLDGKSVQHIWRSFMTLRDLVMNTAVGCSTGRSMFAIWTILCPPMLTRFSSTGKHLHAQEGPHGRHQNAELNDLWVQLLRASDSLQNK